MYGTIDELPEAVRKVLTPEAQAIFLAAYNDVLAEGSGPQGGDSWALNRAWMAVGRQYQLTDGGGYESVTGAAMYTGRQHLAYKEREAITQFLNRKDIYGRPLKKEWFEPTLDEWNGTLLIYADDHVDPEAYEKNPEAELKRVNGRIIKGTNKDTRIDEVGHPTLRTTFDLQDKEVNDGIDNGEISTSNCFYLRKVDGKIVAKPHHILFFRETDKSLPGDRGVLILNKERKDVTLIGRLKARVLGQRPVQEYQEKDHGTEEEDMADEELKTKLATAEKQLAESKLAYTQLEAKGKADMETAIAAKDAKIKGLEDELLAYKGREADARWLTFKAEHIPPGLVADEAKEKALRGELEKDPLMFMAKYKGQLVGFGPGEQGEDDGEDPVQYTTSKGKERKPPVKAEDQLAKMGIPSISFVGGDK